MGVWRRAPGRSNKGLGWEAPYAAPSAVGRLQHTPAAAVHVCRCNCRCCAPRRLVARCTQGGRWQWCYGMTTNSPINGQRRRRAAETAVHTRPAARGRPSACLTGQERWHVPVPIAHFVTPPGMPHPQTQSRQFLKAAGMRGVVTLSSSFIQKK